MIYSTNRTSSLGELSVDVNESYFGIGAQTFYEESAQDELSMFEAAIKSDIDEVLIGESASELQTLNEGFVQNAVNKIKEMMKKFIAWCQAVMRSAFAKLSSLIVRDNAKFAKLASKHIATMKNKDKFKYTGKIVQDVAGVTGLMNDFSKAAESTVKAINVESITVDAAESKIKEVEEDVKLFTKENLMKEFTKEVTDAGFDIVKGQIDVLDALSKKSIKDLKDGFNKAIKGANEVIKKVSKMEGKDNAEKEKIAACSKLASSYKSNTQKMLVAMMGLIKSLAKIARGVVARAMGATPKNEGVEFDEELNEALIEAVEYEYDEALEEMSEGKCEDCEDCDDDDDEDEE